MSRVAQFFSSKLMVALSIAVVAAGSTGAWLYTNHQPVQTVVNAQHQLTQISYHGHAGNTALSLLKAHATVQTKHYSFGDLVVAINGVKGVGPQYWTFYVNHKQAAVGAGAYMTKNSDVITWRLQ